MPRKAWQDLTIRNEFIFQEVLKNTALRKKAVQLLAGSVAQVFKNPKEKEIVTQRLSNKNLKFGIFELDEVADLYEVGQHAPGLGYWVSLYQALLDQKEIESGKHYRDLSDTCIFYIYKFDPQPNNHIVYRIACTCVEDNEIELYMGTTGLIINPQEWPYATDKEFAAFLRYMCTGETGSTLTEEMEREVERVKADTEAAERYNSFVNELDAIIW